MIPEPPDHLRQRWRLYALYFDPQLATRVSGQILIVHLGRPMSLRTFSETYIFQHDEMTVVKTGEKIKTSTICGIQKIDNNNKPDYEITQDGNLIGAT